MKYGILQGCGVALFVLGAQGAIRQLVHHHDTGLLGWLPGGFAAALTTHLLAVVIGALLADRARAAGKAASAGPTSTDTGSETTRC
ncbi:MAG: hypothetical protein HOV87_04675 [Catenulispora sp.]|nr:hypothetical protein [Catenulispora sp.]